MNTPKTDAILASQANGGFGLAKSQCIAQWYDHARQIETQVQELREALEMLNNEFKRLPHSLGYRYTHTGKVDAILEKTK